MTEPVQLRSEPSEAPAGAMGGELPTKVTAVIVGGGFGGLAAGISFKRLGIDEILIVERSSGIGGTWFDNRYPGAEVDVLSHIYSYSFKPYDWTRTHARQEELQGYLNEVASDFGLWPHIRLGLTVEQAVWDDEAATWTVRFDDGRSVECNVLVSGVGFLNEPKYPKIAGMDEFRGDMFHTARWPADFDPVGKRIAVIGTGSTSTQLVPALAEVAEELYVFQREPGWLLPKGERDYTPEERRRNMNPVVHRIRRFKGFYDYERNILQGSFRVDGATGRKREEAARAYIARVFEDRPDLEKAVTPTYPFGGKRTIFASGFYPALKRPNVELVPHAVDSLTETGIVDVLGQERQVDAVVLATGFETANYLPTLDVIGRGGRSLREHWSSEPHALLGVTVPGFPNFVMIYGPNTNGFEIISNLVRQGRYAARMARKIVRGRCRAVEAGAGWCAVYNAWLQNRMQNTVWHKANNYYKAPSGRIVTQWPYGAILYAVLLRTLAPLSEVRR